MDTAAIMVTMAWLATGGADMLREQRWLLRLAAIYGMVTSVRQIAQMWGATDPVGGYYGPGFFVDAYPFHMPAARRRIP